MGRWSLGYTVVLLAGLGFVLFGTGILDSTAQGLAWLLVTAVAVCFWLLEQFLQGYADAS
ncbi:hypothetical protein [Natrialba sp. SSL1]|uniref:hypothetical protein n=1 Tax=Natrialba sp. SSL1 TaxID=1869245 RepID=UPI0008F8F2FE|nr:hypothetical protein [Natrialba sp. SSL1]OIB58445.1 hypothetical protein BBD46_08980 [Natrialba sp. SSL1]